MVLWCSNADGTIIFLKVDEHTPFWTLYKVSCRAASNVYLHYGSVVSCSPLRQSEWLNTLLTSLWLIPLFWCCSWNITINVAPGPSFLITKHQRKLYLEQAVMVNWVQNRTFTQDTRVWILSGRHDSTFHLLCYYYFFRSFFFFNFMLLFS